MDSVEFAICHISCKSFDDSLLCMQSFRFPYVIHLAALVYCLLLTQIALLNRITLHPPNALAHGARIPYRQSEV